MLQQIPVTRSSRDLQGVVLKKSSALFCVIEELRIRRKEVILDVSIGFWLTFAFLAMQS